MTDLTVRVATPNDVETWRALRRDGIARYPQAFMASLDQADAISVAQDAEMLVRGDRFLAFDAGKAVGLAGVNRNGMLRAQHRAEIGPFYVVQEAQGRSVAAALMDAVMAYATRQNIWQLELFVNQDNARAIAFYTRYGFTEAGRIPNSILGADGPETDMIMIRTRP